MSDSDEENFVFYGTPLEPLEEEEITRKKPVTIADQIVVDENGRRRFHGAFTGGFSAGYYNTVGSKEGWAPSTFKSTRSDRTSFKSQNVHDFMDDEDTGVFGIAPQMLRPTEDYTSITKQGKKRPKPTQSDGPIPGIPVLEKIIEPVKSTIGVRLLQKLGWRPGQGIGPRITQAEKKKAKKRKQKKDKDIRVEPENNASEDTTPMSERTYGCVLPPELVKRRDDDSSSSDSYEEIDRDALFAPEDYDAPFYQPKVNTFGLGYKGLDRDSLVSSSHIDLFGSQLKFKVDNKKMNITGEAFGVGAFEEADADIYSHEDMSQYDFALETPEERKQRKFKESQDKANKKKLKSSHDAIEGFCRVKTAPPPPKFFPPPNLSANFQGLHISRKSRFERNEEQEKEDGNKKRVWRHGLTIAERQVLIGEQNASANEITTEKSPASSKNDDKAGVSSTFSSRDSNQSAISNQKPNDAQKMSSGSSVSPAPDASILERVERLKKFTQVLQAFSSSKASNETDAKAIAFKPFMKNPEKQERYEKYLTLVAAGFQECLKDLQPSDMTDWEKEREKLEFQRAAALYKPISGIMSSRFVSAKSHDISHLVPEREIEKEKDPTQDPIVAAKMNLFGKLTHKVVEWHPDKILSKRFNVPPPYPDSNIVGLRAETSVETAASEKRESPKPAPMAKKSLFEDIDFSKPPPGLFPVQTQSSSAKALEFSADSNKSNKSPGMHLEIDREDLGKESPSRQETIATKPSMDLFKEIFADTSSESEEELDSSLKTPSSQVSTFTSGSTKLSSIKMSQERTENRDKLDSSQMRRDDGNEKSSRKLPYNKSQSTRGSKEKNEDGSHSHDRPAAQSKTGVNSSLTSASNKKGVFDNLDFSQLGTSRDTVHKGHHETKSQRVDSTSSSKEEKCCDIIQDDGLLYAPLPPPWLATSTHPNKTSLIPRSSSNSISVSNYSNNQSKRDQTKSDEDEGMWVEKESVKSRSSHSKKKHKKSSKSHKTSSSSLSKKSKGKHKSKDKHKSKKDHKRKSKRKTSKKDKRRTETSSSDEGSDNESSSSSSSIEIHDSLDNRALLNKLKEITRSH